ncbi:hypothetical protein N1851_010315 [Merluccius polli]|uniref:Uncharacterized protein n=1 Tax=Merluccius polli TaxID=89951 RepID=A0AA47MZJ0_MERPO|nr:hypothetical protein N1851_010315 [Merluccius polli]
MYEQEEVGYLSRQMDRQMSGFQVLGWESNTSTTRPFCPPALRAALGCCHHVSAMTWWLSELCLLLGSISGSPLSVVVVSVGDSRLTRLVFVDCQEAPVPHAPAARQVHLVASCRSGTTHALTAGTRAADTRAETLSPR